MMLRYLRDLMKLTDILPYTDEERAARRTAFAGMMNGIYDMADPQVDSKKVHAVAMRGFLLASLYLEKDREAFDRMPPGPLKDEADRLMQAHEKTQGDTGMGAGA